MNKVFTDKFFFFRGYLKFLYKAKGRFSIHSPYLYQLIEQVIRMGSPASTCAPVEELRKRLLGDHRMIRKTDYGSGSGELTVDQYPVKISHLARYSSLPPHRSARLYHLVRFLKAQHILELGTSLGISAAYMAKSNPGARILTLEGCSEVAKLARNNLIDLAIDNVQIIEGNFDKKLSEALNSMDAPDLVFIDGNHRQEPTVRYFRQLVDAAHNNTMFVFDDIHYSREMEQAWQQIISFPEVTASIDLFHQGWVMIKNELSPQHLILNYP